MNRLLSETVVNVQGSNIVLFKKALVECDESGGVRMTLECSQKAAKYLFNTDELGCVKYDLRCITALGSRYSYAMFLYILRNRRKGVWNIDIPTLKKTLNCESEVSYHSFRYFNEKILKLAHGEINELTNLRYDYEPVRGYRSVAAVRFRIAKKGQIVRKNANN